MLTFRPRIPVRKCTFRWLSHKRRRFGNRTHCGNLDRKCRRGKVGGSGNRRTRACKYIRPSKDGTWQKINDNTYYNKLLDSANCSYLGFALFEIIFAIIETSFDRTTQRIAELRP